MSIKIINQNRRKTRKRLKSKRFVRDGSVQRLKIGGRHKSKRLSKSKRFNKRKRFVRDGSVQRLKIGGRN